MSKAATESKWAARVAAWRESGLSAEKFAADRGFAGSTLRFWSQRLPPAVSPAERSSRVAAAGPTPKLELVRVARAPRDATSSVARFVGPHVVELETLRVRVEPGFDEAALRAIVAALRGAP